MNENNNTVERLKSRIQELVVHIDDMPATFESLGLEPMGIGPGAEAEPWGYFLFIKNREQWKLAMFASAEQREELDHSFLGFLDACAPIAGFMQLKLALDLFDRGRVAFNDKNDDLDKLIDIAKGTHAYSVKHPVLDELLAQSNGVLIWRHQLDALLACSGMMNLQDRQEFIKAMNAKRWDTWQETASIKVFGSLPLLSILEDRMLYSQIVADGFWNEPLALYEYAIVESPLNS